jgi:hypothetical protein
MKKSLEKIIKKYDSNLIPPNCFVIEERKIYALSESRYNIG